MVFYQVKVTYGKVTNSDERKEKQLKIALEAKLDNQDKSEVDSRKVLFLTRIMNKSLKLKIQEVLNKNESLEKIYNEIKIITVLTHTFLMYSYLIRLKPT